jgi:hypothetical protein
MTDDVTKQEQEILDGTVWNQFCDTPKTAGNVIMGPNAPGDVMRVVVAAEL